MLTWLFSPYYCEDCKQVLRAETDSAGQGGSLALAATGGQVTLNNSIIDTGVMQAATGHGGNLVIEAAGIALRDGAKIIGQTAGQGQGGALILKAADGQVAINNSKINTGVTYQAVGDGGNLLIKAADITLVNNAEITAKTAGSGAGGSVTLQAAGGEVVLDNSLINTGVEGKKATGNGGQLMIEAAGIILRHGAEITAETDGIGAGGSVILQAIGGQVVLDNSTINTGVTFRAEGKGGQLTIAATDITLEQGAQIIAATHGQGQGGSVMLTGADHVRLSGQGTQMTSSSYGPGSAGVIQIKETAHLTLADGALITSGTESAAADAGNAGQIEIDLSGVLRMSGGSMISTSTTGRGDAGGIQVGKIHQPAVLWMTESARITSGSQSDAPDAGKAGSLDIATSKRIQLHHCSALTTESQNAGGGGIQVNTRDWLYLQDSKIATSVQGGAGRGGDIDVDPVFIILANSQIQANAHGGPGGNIRLVADYLLRSGVSPIEASSALSTSGRIDVQAVDVDGGGMQVMTQLNPLNVAQWTQVPCKLRRGGVSRLSMSGYDAYPTAVDDVLSSLPIRAALQQWKAKPAISPGILPATGCDSPCQKKSL
ncbi:MAG: hypothetical protein AAFO09_01390 [Pseudomonadota bacterium]